MFIILIFILYNSTQNIHVSGGTNNFYLGQHSMPETLPRGGATQVVRTNNFDNHSRSVNDRGSRRQQWNQTRRPGQSSSVSTHSERGSVFERLGARNVDQADFGDQAERTLLDFTEALINFN